MKTMTKEFWATDATFEDIKSGTGRFISICAAMETRFTHKITISWEEEEKKITLSESEFDEAFNCLRFLRLYGHKKPIPHHADIVEIKNLVKKKLFGDKDE